ncbi:MAG: DoxX family protein [Terracidiphilus sp.]
MSGMNYLIWTAQGILAVVFFVAGVTKLLAFGHVKTFLGRKLKGGPIGISTGQGASIGLLEVAGALGLLTPPSIVPNYMTVIFAAAGLALLMVMAGIYHARRKESAAPDVVLFLLAIFVIVSRWGR